MIPLQLDSTFISCNRLAATLVFNVNKHWPVAGLQILIAWLFELDMSQPEL